MTLRIILSVLAVWQMASCSLGALETCDGTEQGFWDSRAVIFGTIKEVTYLPDEGRTLVRLSAIATVTGKFDPALAKDPLELKIGIGFGSAVDRLEVTAGESVIVLLFERNGKFQFDSSVTLFFPSKSGIEQVKDLSDPKAVAIIRRLRELRDPVHPPVKTKRPATVWRLQRNNGVDELKAVPRAKAD